MLTTGIMNAAIAAKNTFVRCSEYSPSVSGQFPVFLMAMMLFSLPQMAEAKDIHWDSLNLTNQQSSEIDNLESTWRKTYAEISPQIQRDTDELMRLLQSPNADPQRMLQLQNRINDNKQRLQSEAMRIHIKKREKLNPEQRVQLQKMISD